MRFSKDEFFERQEPTIGASFVKKHLEIGPNRVCFEIWDTAGQERYRSLAPMYYRGASAALVVYDITKPQSFRGAQSWVKELERRGDAGVLIALAGNKADLESERKVPREEAEAYATANGMLFSETSALVSTSDDTNPLNIRKLLAAIAEALPKPSDDADRQRSKSEAFPIGLNKNRNKAKCC